MRLLIKTIVPLILLVFIGCGDKKNNEDYSIKKDQGKVGNTKSEGVNKNLGIGPITSVDLTTDIDQDLAKKGKEIYEAKCTACHKVDKRYIGPSPVGILERRTPEWVMNMILNPEKMTAEDPDARELLIEYNGTPMANQNLTEEEARAVLEYFRIL